jgi:hypothetical protein
MPGPLLALLLSLAGAFAAPAARAPDPGVKLLRVPNGGIQPQAIVDRSGVLHLLYYIGERTHGDLYYVTSQNLGGTWSQPLRVNCHPGSALAMGAIRGGQLALGRSGHVYVLWNGSSEAQPPGLINPESGRPGAPLLFSRLNDSHTAFEPERNLMTHTFGLDGGSTIANGLAGDIYVAWHAKASGAPAGEVGRQVWIAASHDDGKTFSAEQPASTNPTGACACCGMAMNVDKRGRVRILYRSAMQNVHRDIHLLASGANTRTFADRELDSWQIGACPVTSMALAEGAGKIEAAWENAGQVLFQDLEATPSTPSAAPGEPKARKHPRLAIQANGDTLLAWIETSGWGHPGSLSWQLYDSGGKPQGPKGSAAGVPPWSFAAVVATPAGWLVLY